MNWGSSDRMKKPFTSLAAIIFAVIALVHLLRLVYGWAVTIVGADVPTWTSVLGLVIAGGLAAGLWWESRR
jgi:fatty acid desaturase